MDREILMITFRLTENLFSGNIFQTDKPSLTDRNLPSEFTKIIVRSVIHCQLCYQRDIRGLVSTLFPQCSPGARLGWKHPQTNTT